MRKLTIEQQLQNCMLAVMLWKKVKPSQVIEGLHSWRCGTQACFGGHLATWREFQYMGVSSTDGKSPAMRDQHGAYECGPAGTSLYLFGNPSMFDLRDRDEFPLFPHMTDHQVVMERLKVQIAELASKVRASKGA